MGVRARFYRPRGIALEYATRRLYVADSYNRFVRDHSQAVEDCEATEREFWSYLHSRDKEVAVGEIVALADETAKHSVRQALYHITMGALFRAFAIMSVVLVTFVG